VTAAEIATPCPLAAKPLNYLDAGAGTCTGAPGAPLYCVTRWTGRGWRAASGPLPQRDALDVAARLKAGGVSAFHVRLAPASVGGHPL